jgi:hypothetical protein
LVSEIILARIYGIVTHSQRKGSIMSDKFFSLTTCFKLLDDAIDDLKQNLNSHHYDEVIKYTKRIFQYDYTYVLLIDMDMALDTVSGRVRDQFFEAAQLFKQAGGEIYVYSKHPKEYYHYGNLKAFSRLIPDMTMDDKAKAAILSKFIKDNTNTNDIVFIFGDNMVYQIKLSNSYVIIDVTGTHFLSFYQNQDPLRKYTVVENLMLYLGLNSRMIQMRETGRHYGN